MMTPSKKKHGYPLCSLNGESVGKSLLPMNVPSEPSSTRPNYIPRHKLLPSGPVNPDAMLLSHVYIVDNYRSVMNYVKLINAAVADLQDRGVRAVEAFGRLGNAGSYAQDADPTSALDHICIPTQDVLSACGFKEIVPHPRVSRWRMDINLSLIHI